MFVKRRFGIPLFFERLTIEVTPAASCYWRGGDTSSTPQVSSRCVLAVGPMSALAVTEAVRRAARVPARGRAPSSTRTVTRPASPRRHAGTDRRPPRPRPARARACCPATAPQVGVIVSHIRPQPGIGYDERRYVEPLGPGDHRSRAAWSRRPPDPGHRLGRGGDAVLRVRRAQRARWPSTTSTSVGAQAAALRVLDGLPRDPAARSSPRRSSRSRSAARSPRHDGRFALGWWLLALVAGGRGPPGDQRHQRRRRRRQRRRRGQRHARRRSPAAPGSSSTAWSPGAPWPCTASASTP